MVLEELNDAAKEHLRKADEAMKMLEFDGCLDHLLKQVFFFYVLRQFWLWDQPGYMRPLMSPGMSAEPGL